MADTKLRSPDGREGWFSPMEVAHLTNKPEAGERWTIVNTSEEAPRDPREVTDEPIAPVPKAEEPVKTGTDTPKPVAKKGKGR